MAKIDLDKVFETTNLSAFGKPCLSKEDCKIAEEINRKMKNVCREYSSMVEESYRLCAGLNLAEVPYGIGL